MLPNDSLCREGGPLSAWKNVKANNFILKKQQSFTSFIGFFYSTKSSKDNQSINWCFKLQLFLLSAFKKCLDAIGLKSIKNDSTWMQQ